MSGEHRSRLRSKTARRINKPNSPPEDQPWVWLTRDMLESLAWQSMTLPARRVIDRVILEHMAHAGKENGALIALYDDFVKYSMDRRSIAKAIDIAICLGFLDLIQPGVRAYGPSRRPAIYGLTWLDRADRTAASNRWRYIKTEEDVARAFATVEALEQERSRAYARKHPAKPTGRQELQQLSGALQ